LKKKQYITLEDWFIYYHSLSAEQLIELRKHIDDNINGIITLIPGLLIISHRYIGNYIRTTFDLQIDIAKLIKTLYKNRFSHFSGIKLKALSRVIKYYQYGTRYKLTKRTWRLVRNLLWTFKQYRSKYPELIVSPLRTKGLVDLEVELGPRSYADGNTLREYEDFNYLIENDKKIEAYRKFRIAKKAS